MDDRIKKRARQRREFQRNFIIKPRVETSSFTPVKAADLWNELKKDLTQMCAIAV